MRKAFCLLASGLLLMASAAFADTTEEQVYNNLSHEFVECASYYNIVVQALENGKEVDLQKTYKAMFEDALQHAVVTNKIAGLKDETLSARIDISNKEMRRKIGNSASNIAILNAEYGALCREALQNPKKRIEYWYSKKLKTP